MFVVGGFKFVGDVARCDTLFAFPRGHVGPEPALRHRLLVSAGRGEVQSAVCGPEDRVLLDQPGRRCGAERVGVVGVLGPLAVGAGPAGLVLPVRPCRVVGVRDRAQRLAGPLRRLVRELSAQLGAPRVHGRGQRLEPGPIGVGEVAGQQVGVARHLRVELALQCGADAEVQHLRHRGRAGRAWSR